MSATPRTGWTSEASSHSERTNPTAAAAASRAAPRAPLATPAEPDDEPSHDALIDSARSGSHTARRRDAPSPAASPPPSSAATVPPLLLPHPPDTARPGTSGQQPSGAATPRPNTARDAASTSSHSSGAVRAQQQQHQQQHPRPPTGQKPAPVSTSGGVAAAPAASPGGTGAPAVSHYSVGKTIGEGTFGKVKKGIHKLTGLPVAIKILEKERIVDLADVERVKREIHILTRVRHPNVIRLFEVIDSPRHIFLVMEWVGGGELFDYIVAKGRVQDETACRLFHHILNGVDYVHNKHVIHRDLKPENILLNEVPKGSSTSGGGASAAGDAGLKIVDFGLGNVVKNGKLLKTACGSPCYAAPEMLRCIPRGSEVLRHDGRPLRVEQVRAGERLLGENGRAVRVTSCEPLLAPEGLYRIVASASTTTEFDYEVSAQHRVTLRWEREPSLTLRRSGESSTGFVLHLSWHAYSSSCALLQPHSSTWEVQPPCDLDDTSALEGVHSELSLGLADALEAADDDALVHEAGLEWEMKCELARLTDAASKAPQLPPASVEQPQRHTLPVAAAASLDFNSNVLCSSMLLHRRVPTAELVSFALSQLRSLSSSSSSLSHRPYLRAGDLIEMTAAQLFERQGELGIGTPPGAAWVSSQLVPVPRGKSAGEESMASLDDTLLPRVLHSRSTLLSLGGGRYVPYSPASASFPCAPASPTSAVPSSHPTAPRALYQVFHPLLPHAHVRGENRQAGPGPRHSSSATGSVFRHIEAAQRAALAGEEDAAMGIVVQELNPIDIDALEAGEDLAFLQLQYDSVCFDACVSALELCAETLVAFGHYTRARWLSSLPALVARGIVHSFEFVVRGRGVHGVKLLLRRRAASQGGEDTATVHVWFTWHPCVLNKHKFVAQALRVAHTSAVDLDNLSFDKLQGIRHVPTVASVSASASTFTVPICAVQWVPGARTVYNIAVEGVEDSSRRFALASGILTHNSEKYVGPGVDCWSLGVILFALLAGYLPFEDANTSRLYEKIMGGEYEVPDTVSELGKDLIGKLLNTDPRKRYNAEQVRRHPWYARLHVPTDPVFTLPGGGIEDPAQVPVVPGPHASGRRVKQTRGGHAIDDEEAIDQAIIAHMAGMGYQAQQVAESVERRRHDHMAATYHLLLIKKQMESNKGKPAPPIRQASAPTHGVATQQQQQQPPQSQSGRSNGAPVPRIPTGPVAGGGAPMVPSAPVAVHHHQPVPPSSQRPTSYTNGRSGAAATANPAFMQTQPLPSSTPPPHPQPPSTVRVQSAGTVRPVPPQAPPASARPTTSYATAHHPHPPPPHGGAHAAWQSGPDAQSSPMPTGSPVAAPGLGVANGVNGGTGVNAYMQHYQAQQQQQASIYGQQPGYNYASRPPSSSPTRGGSAPKSAGSARGAGAGSGTIATPKSNTAYRVSSTGRAGRALSSTMPMGYPNSYRASASPSPSDNGPGSSNAAVGGSPIMAVGPATGRPMTSRITGSTGGVSHRLYLPPQEKAAHDLAAAAAAAAMAAAGGGGSRPGTSTGSRPSSSYHVSRPGTSHQHRNSGARPPSAGLAGLGGGVVGGGLGLGLNVPGGGSGGGVAVPGSSFSAQLSAMSFKPARAILDELQRVLTANGLQCTLLPPSGGSATTPSSPLLPNKHGFAGATSASGGLAPISISSLRPQSRALVDGVDSSSSSSASTHHVLECRQGSHRFQFHVTPLPVAAARIALEMDGASGAASAAAPTHSYSIRVKRVLGDAHTFRDMCARILPQLKL